MEQGVREPDYSKNEDRNGREGEKNEASAKNDC